MDPKEFEKARYLAAQAKLLTARGIDRRTFMTRALAAGLAVPAALSMSGRAMAQTPQSGGVFRHGAGYGSTTDSLDPGTAENSFMTSMCYTRGNHLTEVSNTGELIPELAESYETEDAKTWRFNIRKGVEFHSGKTLTPEDVVATFNYHRGEAATSAAKGLLTQVEDIAVDGDAVVFTLADANADFPFIVSDYHLLIMESDGAGGVDPTSTGGTGGYVVQTFEPGVRAIHTRNPNYWKEGRAHFDEYHLLSILDAPARQQALMSGEVDFIDNVTPNTLALMERVPNLTVLQTTGTQHYTFPMRVTSEPFSNYDLRMALKFAINRQELVDKILLGAGAVGNDVPVNASMPYFDPDLPVHSYDPERAREHYEKSGHSGPIVLRAADAAFPGAVDAAQLVAASAAAAGIDIQVERVPSDGYWSNVWNKEPWCACYWGGRPTQDWMYSSAYIDTQEWNDTDWRTGEAAERFNEVVVQARAETDETNRGALYSEAQRLLQDDGGAIIAMFANYIHAHSNALAHEDAVAANWISDGNKVHERWWFS